MQQKQSKNLKQQQLPCIQLQKEAKYINFFKLTIKQVEALQKLLPAKYSFIFFKKINQTPKKSIKRQVIDIEEANNQSNINPLKIKSQLEKKCRKILVSLQKSSFSWPFIQPVNPIKMGIPSYLQIIKTPMDLRTISNKLSQSKYEKFQDFQFDIKLIIINSYKFNEGNSQFIKIISQFENYYNKLAHQQTAKQTPRKQTPLKNTKKTKNTRSFARNSFTPKKKQELISKFRALKTVQKQQLAIKVNGNQYLTMLNFNSLNDKQLKKVQGFIQNIEVQNTMVNENKIFQQTKVESKQIVQSSFSNESES